jgi:hypothetical protein
MTRAYAAILAITVLFLAFPSDAKSTRAPGGTPSSAQNLDDAAKQGDRIRRAQEAQDRKWDAEMGKMMKSICRGC